MEAMAHLVHLDDLMEETVILIDFRWFFMQIVRLLEGTTFVQRRPLSGAPTVMHNRHKEQRQRRPNQREASSIIIPWWKYMAFS